tara:strand:- start:685 stop:825 length:141 start_codon:yes stop_codon:yes gene_type:complete
MRNKPANRFGKKALIDALVAVVWCRRMSITISTAINKTMTAIKAPD